MRYREVILAVGFESGLTWELFGLSYEDAKRIGESFPFHMVFRFTPEYGYRRPRGSIVLP